MENNPERENFLKAYSKGYKAGYSAAMLEMSIFLKEKEKENEE